MGRVPQKWKEQYRRLSETRDYLINRQNDLVKVTNWLESQGFHILSIGGGHNSVVFSGPASQAQAAFGTEIHRYVVNGESHFANATNPSLPVTLANVALGVHGMSDFRAKPRGVRTVRREASMTGRTRRT